MRRISIPTTLLLFTGFVLIAFVFSFPAHAAESSYMPAGQDALRYLDQTANIVGLSDQEPSSGSRGDSSVLNIIGTIINTILGFVGITFFIQIFWTGIRWMNSGGNDEVISQAKKTIKTAVIGITVIFSAFLITNFLLNKVAQIQDISPTAPHPPPETRKLCELNLSESDSNCFGEIIYRSFGSTRDQCIRYFTENELGDEGLILCSTTWDSQPL
jgi:hypothetical protein